MEPFTADLRSKKPNNYFLGKDGAKRKADGPALVFAASLSDVQQALLSIIHSEPRTRIIEAEENAANWHFIQKTKLVGFIDDIKLRFEPSAEGAEPTTALSIFSASRVGYSDLGVNEKRVTALIAKLTDSLGAEKLVS